MQPPFTILQNPFQSEGNFERRGHQWKRSIYSCNNASAVSIDLDFAQLVCGNRSTLTPKLEKPRAGFLFDIDLSVGRRRLEKAVEKSRSPAFQGLRLLAERKR